MILVKRTADLTNLLHTHRKAGKTIGFVPTMGALHAGHLALIGICRAESDLTVCSIFVNPTQFNNSTDFEKYPVTIGQDINLLEEAGCDILFLPAVAEMYPANEAVVTYDLGYLENILEGKYRPGHFQGVCRIVDKLLLATQPNTLYLGQKDYQQCLVIAKMLALKNHTVRLQICETLREPGGLAMSSRNVRLSSTARQQATLLFKTLQGLRENLKPGELNELTENAHRFLTSQGFNVDYVAIASVKDLSKLTTWDGQQEVVALLAAAIEEVRLIDNVFLN